MPADPVKIPNLSRTGEDSARSRWTGHARRERKTDTELCDGKIAEDVRSISRSDGDRLNPRDALTLVSAAHGSISNSRTTANYK